MPGPAPQPQRLFIPALLLIMALLLLAIAAPSQGAASRPADRPAQDAAQPPEPAAPLDTPFTLVPQDVNDYDLDIPKLFWHTMPVCQPLAPEPEAPAQNYTEEAIRRIATYGSSVRTLFYNEVNAGCGQQDLKIRSTIAADAGYVYWFNEDGLMRLSMLANEGDPPQLLSAQVTGTAGEVVDDDEYVYALNTGNGQIWQVSKADGSATHIFTSSGASHLSADGDYIYWLAGGGLRRYSPGAFAALVLDNGVTGYYAEPQFNTFFGPIHNVYYAKGHEIYVRSNISGDTSGPLYTAAQANAVIHTLTADSDGLYFFEAHPHACGSFTCYQDILRRTERLGGAGTTVHAYAAGTAPGAFQAHQLKSDGSLLFWRDGGLQRLPNDASALSEVNVKITDVEITQGVQDVDNDVPLIPGKRTFVRVHVEADGVDVPGVTARLSATWNGGQGNPIPPANPVGTAITIKDSPDRNNVDDSFVFELPWHWTEQEGLELQIRVNPFQLPLEPDYSDNEMQVGPLTFLPSQRLEVQFVAWGYEVGDQIYYPRFVEDVLATYSWIRRTYPLASAPGGITDPAPGLRPNLMYIFDQNLEYYVKRIAPDCIFKLKTLSLCASAYTNTLMNFMRISWGVPGNRLMYGLISDQAGWFPRGQACCGHNVASGPAGPPGGSSWDTDTTYADWYTGHELGHLLGRAHPVPAGDFELTEEVEGCGHSRSDPDFPYAGAAIGPGDLLGFDPGDPSFNIPMAVYPDNMWRDLMSYCDFQWISDYTYKAMYNHLAIQSLAPAPGAPRQGDLVSVLGIIVVDGDQAHIQHLRRTESVAMAPPLVPGPYAIRLLDGEGDTLADYPFTPQEAHDSEGAFVSFGQVVDWAPGTAEIQIVRLGDGKVMASEMASANPPTMSDVQVTDADGPLTGEHTVTWTAGDPDGDDLTFDLLYSQDGGSWQPLQTSLSAPQAPIDAGQLMGSSVRFRVVAGDGVHGAQADSPVYDIAPRPPQVRILTPGAETHIQWGQLVNFSGEVHDWQDGALPHSALEWRTGDGELLGAGPLLSTTDLPVGHNEITLSAANSEGLTGSDTVLVIVGDDLSLPGPTLTAAPMQLGWHLSADDVAPQTAQVTIHNGGSGALSWEASVDAGWLTLSDESGDAPSTLTLTADPDGLAPGESVAATLTLANPDNPAQTLSIPVSLTVGATWTHPAGFREPTHL
ncbi:MAG TPA: hypothetical protein VK879_15180 [Candidatus Sulfomarinibacteraceae bacterium]|nr:hypothetical protein [Candidatus Sulfomarinibacteraceae bacterium]